jgi:branched-subunit amino acid aminotransferase/4-amino-4-deoxychorismate lyase
MIPPARASVSIFNPAIYGAYGVYESLQVTRGAIFALKEHLRRLEHSAALLDLPLPADLLTFEAWCHEVLKANQATECTLRLFVVGGEGGEAATAYLWPQPPTIYPPSYYAQGVPVITFEGQRFMPEAKSLNTLASTMARRRARALGAHEGLLHHDGFLTEGAVSNLFAVIDGAVVTPPAGTVLSGVTRDIVMRQAARGGLPITEAPLPMREMAVWQECFITSTGRHVMPVASVDGCPVGDGRVGPLTRRLGALFEDCFRQTVACVA